MAMWTNLTGVVGGVIQNVQKIQREIETQLDNAVGVDGNQNQFNTVSVDTSAIKIESQAADAVDNSKDVLFFSRSSSSHGEKSEIILPVPPDDIALDPVDPPVKKNDDCQVQQSRIQVGNDRGVCSAEEWVSAQHQIRQHANEIKQVESRLQEMTLLEQKSVQSHAAEIERFKAQFISREQELLSQLETEKSHRKSSDQLWQELLTKQEQQFKLELSDRGSSCDVDSNTTNESNNQTAGEMNDLRQRLTERERSLESTAQLLSESHLQLENIKIEVEKKDQLILQLQSDLATAHTSNATAPAASAAPAAAAVIALEREIQRLNEQLKNRDDRLSQFMTEGQILAKKQSDMEKAVRTAKTELNKKEEEIKRLKESKEQLTRVIEETQDALKKQQQDSINSSKSLSAMQAVSQASADKLTRLEAELTARMEELSNQRRALESAWTENTDLKRTVTELKTECDDLRRQLGEGASRVMETESSRRDVEQREAVLRATSRQLQESLTRQMSEASQREERLREELLDTRRRWQEAVALRESAASELSQATAPLLRQIAALQETLRLKQDQWQSIEGSLTERALRAEAMSEAFEHRRVILEEQSQANKQQLVITNNRLIDTQQRLETAEASLQRLRRVESELQEQRVELESKLAMEIAQTASLRSSLRELEVRHALDLQEVNDSHETRREMEVNRLRQELSAAKEMIIAAMNNNNNNNNNNNSNNSNNNNGHHRLERGSKEDDSNDEEGRGQSSSLSSLLLVQQQSPPTNNNNNSNSNNSNNAYNHSSSSKLVNGENSFVATEKQYQRTRLRDDTIQALQTQVNQLQSSRNALLEEVSYLSGRNAQLEDETAALPQLKTELEAAQKRLEVLLCLLGEKEEELEGVLQDMKEVKLMYRSQLEELLERALSLQSQSSSKTDHLVCMKSDTAAGQTMPVVGQLRDNEGKGLTNTKIVLNGGSYSTYSRFDGSFVFHDIPSGIYALDVYSPLYHFPTLKLKVMAEDSNKEEQQSVSVVEYKYLGAKKQQADYPITLTALTPIVYTLPKPQFSIIGIIMANPMMIMMLVSLLMVVGMPMLMKNLSPEELEEIQKNSMTGGDPMQKLSKLMGGAAQGKAADDDDE